MNDLHTGRDGNLVFDLLHRLRLFRILVILLRISPHHLIHDRNSLDCKVTDANDSGYKAMQRGVEKKADEVADVSKAYASSHHGTVMVMYLYAEATIRAVIGTGRPHYLASTAER